MATYYLSACHDCKKVVMWAKCTDEQAKEWHDDFHSEHKTEFASEYDYYFWYRTKEYDDLGISG